MTQIKEARGKRDLSGSAIMKIRLQYCPVCSRQTPHAYQPASISVAGLGLLCGLLPGILYLWYAIRRAERAAYCTVNHRVLEEARTEARLRELVRALRSAHAGRVPSRRGITMETEDNEQ